MESERQKIYNRIRRPKSEVEKEQNKAVAREISAKLKPLREDLKTAQSITERYPHIPHILDMVDEGRIAFTPAVELSYLQPKEQAMLLSEMEYSDCTPNLSQAQRLKALSIQGLFTKEQLSAIMSEEKANQKERVKIPVERIQKYFPKDYTTTQMEETIVKLCEAYHRKRLRDRDSR